MTVYRATCDCGWTSDHTSPGDAHSAALAHRDTEHPEPTP